MPAKIDIKHLKEFARKLEGKRLFTMSQKKAFEISMEQDGFRFTPESSGTPRKMADKNIIQVTARFNEMHSFQPKDYTDITMNSVYILSLIDSYCKHSD